MDRSFPSSTRYTSGYFEARCETSRQPPSRCITRHKHSRLKAKTRAEYYGSYNGEVGTFVEKRTRRGSQSGEHALVSEMKISIAASEVGESSPLDDLGSQCREDPISAFGEGVSIPDPETIIRAGCNVKRSPERKATNLMSPFFKSIRPESPCSRMAYPEPVSCLRFPARGARVFGLIQERLSDDPFGLLVAVIFLHQTKGAVAIPILLSFMQVFSAPEILATASADNIAPFIRPLGLQNRRAELLVALARAWLRHPPEKGKRYRSLHYPHHGAGADIGKDEEPLEDDDARFAWEIAHLPGVGPYALDSWRIFCRDALRDQPSKSNQSNIAHDEEDAVHSDAEWTRVLPLDKELRAYLQWRWIGLGWLWDPLSGNRLKVKDGVLESMEALEVSDHKGFVNPWMSSKGMAVPEEQILGRFVD